MSVPKLCLNCPLGYVAYHCRKSVDNPNRSTNNDAYKIPGRECPFVLIDQLRTDVEMMKTEITCLTNERNVSNEAATKLRTEVATVKKAAQNFLDCAIVLSDDYLDGKELQGWETGRWRRRGWAAKELRRTLAHRPKEGQP